MSDFYERMAATAARLIGKFGKPIDVSGRRILGINRGIEDTEIDGSRIQRGDRSIIFTDPVQIGETVNDIGAWYIYDVQVKQPADTPLVYIAYMRQ